MIGFLRNQAEVRAARLRDLSPIVLMGRGHSGTRVFASCCSLLGVELAERTGQTGDPVDTRFTDEVKRLAMRSLDIQSTTDVPRSLAVRFQRAVARFYDRLELSPDAPWGWKFPETYLIAPIVLDTFPNARFIHMVRDGRDIAFKRHLTDDPGRPLGRKLLAHIGATELPRHQQAALSWQHQVTRFLAFSGEIPSENLLTLTFEDMCAQPSETGARISEFLGLPMNQETRRYLDTEVNAKKLGQYKHEPEEDIASVEERIGKTLAQLGYK